MLQERQPVRKGLFRLPYSEMHFLSMLPENLLLTLADMN